MPNHVYCHITIKEEDKITLKKLVDNERGIAGSLIPMPKELEKTTSPTRIVSEEQHKLNLKKKGTEKFWSNEITQAMSEDFKDRFLFDNWYDWSHFHYGTKWGCYDNELDDTTYTFTTAWSPLSEDILERLAKHIPSFYYTYEEETGWGGSLEFENGVCIESKSYDCPSWGDEHCFVINKAGVIMREDKLLNLKWDKESTEKRYNQVDDAGERWASYCEVCKLEETHNDGYKESKVGWYFSWNLSDYLGETLEDALNTIAKNEEVKEERNPIIWG